MPHLEEKDWISGKRYANIRSASALASSSQREEPLPEYLAQRVSEKATDLRKARDLRGSRYTRKFDQKELGRWRIEDRLHNNTTIRCVEENATEKKSPPRVTSADIRDQLQESFSKLQANHAYGTSFPPLLRPFQKQIKKSTARSPQRSLSPTPLMPQGAEKNVPEAKPREYFSVVQARQTRNRPESGPPPFYPSGSNFSVFRSLTPQHTVYYSVY